MLRKIIAKLLGWIPDWLGFVLVIAAGILGIVAGVMQGNPCFIAFGVAVVVSAILAWINGATSEPKIDVSKKSFGGKVANVDDWVMYVVFGLFAVAIIVCIVTR